jgi:hypothetical protein
MSRLDSIGIAKQSALGTKQTTMEYFPPVKSAEYESTPEAMEVEETTGTPFPSGLDYGTVAGNVTVEGEARVNSLPRILSAFWGAPTTTAPEGTARKHAFDPATAASLVPHSILINRTDPSPAITDLPYDCVGNSLSMNVGVNGYISYEAQFLSAANDDARPEPTVTLDNSVRLAFDDAAVFIDIAGGGENEIKVGSFGFTYNNNIEDDNFVLGSRFLYSVVEGNRDAEFTFTPKASLSAHYRRALLANPESVKLRMRARGALITGATYYEIEVIAHNLEYISAPAGVDAGSRLREMEITARAALNVSTGKFVTGHVQNTVTAY